MGSYYGWKPYVPVAARKAAAQKQIAKLRKKGIEVKPVQIEGRKIARTFWGAAWCDHLESFSDYENRLPRGRTYVRNGSVCHLDVSEGRIDAIVSGSTIYSVEITIAPLSKTKWKSLKQQCAGKIGSLLELLQGKISDHVMAVVTDRTEGLFPLPKEITMSCNCPDWAGMCKHVAAVLYGVGARLDEAPELLFLLRGVAVEELIAAELDATGIASTASTNEDGGRRLADDSISDVFGIDVDIEENPPSDPDRDSPADAPVEAPAAPKRPAKPRAKRSVKPPTGASVRTLRNRLGLTQGEFARLLGVSTGTVSGWERSSGRLNLQTRTADALKQAKKLSKKKARDKLGLS